MNGLESFIPIILIFVIMYFLLIRPQQKKIKEHKNMVDNLRRGDQVLTQGGILAKITKVKEGEEIEVELAKDVKVTVIRSTICLLYTSPSPRDATLSRMPSSA